MFPGGAVNFARGGGGRTAFGVGRLKKLSWTRRACPIEYFQLSDAEKSARAVSGKGLTGRSFESDYAVKRRSFSDRGARS